MRGPVDLAGQIDAHDVRADQAERLGLLEVLRLDRGRGRRDLGERRDLAVAQAPAGLRVDHHARLGGQLGNRHIPPARGVVEQHAAHLRPKGPERLEVAADGVRPSRVHLAAEAGIAVEFVVGRRGDDAHLRPVGVELLGDDEGERGQGALPHLNGRRLDVDRAVRRDAHPRIEGLGTRRGRRGEHRPLRLHGPEAGAAGEQHAERQAGRADHELAPRDIE